VSGQDRRWNHNIHYYPLILAAVPAGCERVLDVGCGEGMLARQLAYRVPHVVGIDQDGASIEAARSQGRGQIEFVCGDFLTHPFPSASFSMITCVAALHHMNAAAALARMSQLLVPGGTLVILGLARSQLPDLPWEAVAVIANLGCRMAKGYWEQPSPTVWPPLHSYRQIRALAGEALPGVRYRRHLLWRYSLSWVKPAPYKLREAAGAIRPSIMSRLASARPLTRSSFLPTTAVSIGSSRLLVRGLRF
jgi:SAM-dependent methyltransferase